METGHREIYSDIKDLQNELVKANSRIAILEKQLMSSQMKADLTGKIMDAVNHLEQADNGKNSTGHIIIAVSQLADVLQVVVTQLGDFTPGNEDVIGLVINH